MVLQRLVQLGARLEAPHDNDTHTPMIHSISCLNIALKVTGRRAPLLMFLFLSSSQARDSYGYSGLLRSVEGGNTELTKSLLMLGAQVDGRRGVNNSMKEMSRDMHFEGNEREGSSERGETALMLACQKKQHNIIQILLGELEAVICRITSSDNHFISSWRQPGNCFPYLCL